MPEDTPATNRARLRTYADDATPPPIWTPRDAELEDFERVRMSLFMAVIAESIPRRLGKGAEPFALALDKKIARMVANAYRSTWATYVRLGAPPAPGWTSRGERLALAIDAEPEDRRAGAQVRWPSWIRERRLELVERRAIVASFALSEGLVKWGVRRARVLTDEIKNTDRIANELVRRVRRP